MSFESNDESKRVRRSVEQSFLKEKDAFSPELVRRGDVYEMLYEAQYGFLPEDHVVTRSIDRILKDYPGKDNPARIRVSLDNASPDAFVLPNGTIVVNRQLLSMLDLQEMKVVIAHEVTHYRRRDAEEFFQSREQMLESGQKRTQTIGLVGRMRAAEYRADIQGTIEGDEAGTHPAALRTLMQKLENWQREQSEQSGGEGDPSLVHGREIERIVNAGMAAQVYDFSTEYQIRESLGEEVQAFCKADIPRRFPESSECEGEDARAAFQNKKILDVLQCIRSWRESDRVEANAIQEREEKRLEDLKEKFPSRRKELTKQLEELQNKPVEVPMVGEGYLVAKEVLEEKVRAALSTSTDLQQKALVHFLMDSVATIGEEELLDGPIEDLTTYLERIQTREDLRSIASILTPETFELLGVVFTDGAGLERFTGALFRAANESGIFEEGKVFDVDGYLEESRAYTQKIGQLLEERSLTGKQGHRVSEKVFEELLLNIDVRESHKAVVDVVIQFQESLLEAGLPVYPHELLKVIEKQHYFRDLEAEEIKDEDIEKTPFFHKGGTIYDQLLIRLYSNLHPYFGHAPVWKYGEAVSCPGFNNSSSEVIVEGISEKMEQVRDRLFSCDATGRRSNLFDAFKESGDSAFRRQKSDALLPVIAGMAEVLLLPERICSLEDLGHFCEAMNRIEEDITSVEEGRDGARRIPRFPLLVEFVVVYLYSQIGSVDWLPPTKSDALYLILETIARFPGMAVSHFFHDAASLEYLVSAFPLADQKKAAFHIAKVIVNHDRLDERDPEAHARRIYFPLSMASLLGGDDYLLPVFGMLKRAYTADLAIHPLTDEECLKELERLDEFFFAYRQLIPLLPNHKDVVENDDEDFAHTFLERYVHDLGRSVDRQILLRLSSHFYDPMTRSRVVRAVVDRELTACVLSVREKIDLLWKNPHVRTVPLGRTRERVVDEDVQSPEDLDYLRECIIKQADQVIAPEHMGVYALLERLERKKDAFEFFRIAYEYSHNDEEARREIFLLIRQDWMEEGYNYRDEYALLRTESILQNLEASDEVMKHAFIRKILIGEKGLLHEARTRRKLFEYLLHSGVNLAASSPELVHVVDEVLDVAAKCAETDVLFMALAPFLQERLFLPAKKRAPWSSILQGVYGSKHVVKSTLADLEFLRNIQRGGGNVTSDDRKRIPIDQRLRMAVEKIGVDLSPEVRAEELPTLETLVVRIAESIGANGVRFLQVLGQYVEDLPPHLEQGFQNANDNVRGQAKLTAYETLKRRAPELRVARMGKRLGGGSLMSPYDADVMDPSSETGVVHEALKVIAPNVGYLSDTVEATIFRIVDGLIERDAERYEPAKRALQDISGWIRADIGDTRYFDLDPDFRRRHSGFHVPGLRYDLYIPQSRVVAGDAKAPANKYVKREEKIEGITLNKLFTESRGHNLKHVMAMIAKVFAQQLVVGVMHSDIHPGNYMVFNREGKDWIAMIDRSLYLELNQQDQALVLGLTQDGVTTKERGDALKAYFEQLGQTQEESFWDSLAKIMEGAGPKGIHKVMARLRRKGYEIPLKLTLLLKNVASLQRMCQRAGFASFREALGYLPE